MQGFGEAFTSYPHTSRGNSPPCRSTEEIIALFISITFVLDAVKGMVKSEYESGVLDTPLTLSFGKQRQEDL